MLLLLTSPPSTLRAVGGGSAAGPSHSRTSRSPLHMSVHGGVAVMIASSARSNRVRISIAARAQQQHERMRRLGVLMPGPDDDEGYRRLSHQLGPRPAQAVLGRRCIWKPKTIEGGEWKRTWSSSLLLSGATMSQQSSLTQSAHSVRQVLTAYNSQNSGNHFADCELLHIDPIRQCTHRSVAGADLLEPTKSAAQCRPAKGTRDVQARDHSPR